MDRKTDQMAQPASFTKISILSLMIVAPMSIQASELRGHSKSYTNSVNGENYVKDDQKFSYVSPNVVPEYASTASAVMGNQGKAAGWVSARMGQLKAYAYADHTLDTTNTSNSTTETSTEAIDYLNITSDTLEMGTDVSLTVWYRVSGNLVGTGASAQFQLYAGEVGSDAVGANLVYDSAMNPLLYQSTTLNTYVGSTIYLDGVLTATATTGNGGTLSEANYGHTANYFVKSNSPDVKVISESGHNYEPVPEPMTMGALALGVMAGVRRKSIKSKK